MRIMWQSHEWDGGIYPVRLKICSENLSMERIERKDGKQDAKEHERKTLFGPGAGGCPDALRLPGDGVGGS